MSGVPSSSRQGDPFRDFEREVGRLFQTLQTPQAWRAARPYPSLNLYEIESAFVLTAEVPGMDAGSLDLSLAGDTLTLRGERKRPEGVVEDSYRRQERPFGKWSRSVTLPGGVEGEKVAAHYAHGVLTVTLPKAAEGRPRQIAVTTSP